MYDIKKEQKQYCYIIDIYKFLFTVGVCLMHYEGAYFFTDNMIFDGFYLAVDFFFVLSGFFLYKSFKSTKYINAGAYTINKVKEFIRYNVIMIAAFVLYNIVKEAIELQLSVQEVVTLVIRIILSELNEVFFLQMFLPSEMYNFPIWYISVLIVIGYCLYWCLEKCKNALELMPLISLVLYMLLYVYHGTIDLHMARDVDGLLYRINPGIFRGLADMILGVVGCEVLERVKLRNNALIRIITYGAMLAIIFLFPHTGLDYVFPILAMVCIINEFSISKTRIIPKDIYYLRKLSISMYFVHTFVIRLRGLQQKICEWVNYDMFTAMVIEFIVVLLASVILDCSVTFVDTKIVKRQQRKIGK